MLLWITGASINVIYLEMMKSLGIKDMKLHNSPIMFGDASLESTFKFITDYPMKVGDCEISIELLVLEMAENRRVSLIFGRLFLTIIRACIA